MNKTNKCPKCGGNNIINPRPKIAGTGSGVFLAIPLGMLRAAFMCPYICCDCGFVEFWVDDNKELEALETKYKQNQSGGRY